MWAAGLGDVDAIIDRALAEDLPGADVTSEATIPATAQARAELVAKAPLCVCGLHVAQRVFERLGAQLQARVRDADGAEPGDVIAVVGGSARAVLTAERTALNFLQRLSGVATLTRRFVEATGGRCRITDTRKTTPGLRALQRYAVRCGGGHNHRNDLTAGVLIKENHIRCAGGVGEAVRAARHAAPHPLRIECEVTDLAELEAALAAGADAVLLDNMDDAEVERAVAATRGRAFIEVSGSVDLARVPKLAALGIDAISVGALTHSAPAADLSLLVVVGDAVTA